MSLKHHAKEVLDLIERGTYCANDGAVSIESQIRLSLDGSRLYSPNDLSTLRARAIGVAKVKVDVVNGTTQTVAQKIAESSPVVLLNFASARNPGGGLWNGAKAQEEDLCRCSAL